MFNLREFIVKNIVDGIKNGTFSKEYGNIMAVNYLVKGILVEEDIAFIDAEITAWEEEKAQTPAILPEEDGQVDPSETMDEAVTIPEEVEDPYAMPAQDPYAAVVIPE